jgi:hypothetical protein
MRSAATVPKRETECAVFAGPVRELSCGVALRRSANWLAAWQIFALEARKIDVPKWGLSLARLGGAWAAASLGSPNLIG